MDSSRKEAIFERDQWYCQIAHLLPGECDRGLTVHHRFEREFGGSDRKANLTSVCRRHHDIIHGMDKSVSKGWIVVARQYGYICDTEPDEPLRIIARPGNVEPMPKAAAQPPGRKAAEKAQARQLASMPLIPRTPPPGHRPGQKDTRMITNNIETIKADVMRVLYKRQPIPVTELHGSLSTNTETIDLARAVHELTDEGLVEVRYIDGEARLAVPLTPERTEDNDDLRTLVTALGEHQLALSHHVHSAVRLLYFVLLVLGFILFFMVRGTVVL